jgi:hypothetical protein
MQVLYVPRLTLKTERIQIMYANVESERLCLMSCYPADVRQDDEPPSLKRRE